MFRLYYYYYYYEQNNMILPYRIWLSKINWWSLFWINVTVGRFFHSLKWNLVHKDINFYVCTETWNMQHFIGNLQHDMRLTAEIGKKGETVNHDDRRNTSRCPTPITLIVPSPSVRMKYKYGLPISYIPKKKKKNFPAKNHYRGK